MPLSSAVLSCVWFVPISGIKEFIIESKVKAFPNSGRIVYAPRSKVRTRGVSLSDSESENAEPKPRIQRGEILPVIFGFGGTALNPLERSLFERFNPFGFILFKRNCKDPDQVRWLIKELKYTVARDDIPILIDQEGGRVARLGPPHWPKHPPARFFGRMFEEDPAMSHEAMQIYARLVARELHSLGINVNCAPVVDLFMEGASQAIGDRALSRKPAIVAELARTCAETFLSNGIIPVIKHLPGHGRVRTDPHDMLPVIEASRAELETEDFVPFELLKDIPAGMNSHAVFMAIDSQPASMSAVMHQDIIRGHWDSTGFCFPTT